MKKQQEIAKRMIYIILLMLCFVSCKKEDKQEGVLRTALTVDIDSLNPYQVVSSASKQILLNVFEGLVMPLPEGGVRPALAESYEVSEDGKTYQFRIRDGIKFHNGNPLDIHDVEYSLKKMSGRLGDTPSQGLFANIDTIEVADDKNIKITLKQPDSSFIYYMKEAIVPDENGDNLRKEAIGTGPYKIISYDKEQKIILEENNDYWGEKPSVERIEILVSPNSETNFLKLLSGEINFLTDIDSKRLPELQEYSIVSYPRNLSLILALNQKVKPFDDVDVRKAISMGIDREELIQVAMNGFGIELYTNMSPVMKKFLWEGKNEKVDRELAKKILAKKGISSLKIDLKVPNNSKVYSDVAQNLKQQLKEIGVELNIEMIEWASWLSDVYTDRKYEATLAGLSGKMEPDAILRRYTSDYAKNFTNFQDEEYDELIRDAKLTSDETRQIKDYKEAQKILKEKQAAVFLMDPYNIIAMDKNIEGYVSYPLPYLDFSKLVFKK